MKAKITWDGSASLANAIFGECYGIDWKYVSRESLDIIVQGRIIKVGEEI